jgi:tetratricopeptide (TPR) repeat protein
VNLASIYDQEGNRALANEYLVKALKVGPGDPTVNLNVGLYYLRVWNPEAAIHHLAKAMKEKKLESKSLMYLGIASKQRGQYEVSENQFKDSLALNPKNITPDLHLAEIYIRTGRETEARMEVERIIGLLIRDRNLFGEVMDLIMTEGDRGDVLLSGDLLLPFLARALEDTPNAQMREEIKKMMEKRTEIR